MTPIITTDPAGDMPGEEKLELACEITEARLFNGLPLENLIGGISAHLNGYDYFYYLQDAVNFCLRYNTI